MEKQRETERYRGGHRDKETERDIGTWRQRNRETQGHR